MIQQKQKTPDRLYRFTSIKNMMQTVKNNLLVLSDPENRQDRNDAKQLAAYCRSQNAKVIRAFCMTETGDSLTHWNADCRITMYVPELITSLKNIEGVQFDKVRYKKLVNVQKAAKTKRRIADLPFLKRYPYNVEKEWRILWLGSFERGTKKYTLKKIPICRKTISEITISQSISDKKYDFIKKQLLSFGLKSRQIHHSTLNENQRWLSALGI